jgi:hypothetical protein
VKLKPVFGANMAIFFLFFGLAVLDAVGRHSWMAVTFWLAISLAFLFAKMSELSPSAGARSR